MPHSNVHGIEIINVTPPLIFLVAEILNGYPQDVYFQPQSLCTFLLLLSAHTVYSHDTQSKETAFAY